MPHRNRVDPWGRLIATPARCAWFGNRGCLHDRSGTIRDRAPPTDAWIICLLRFKGRRRALLQPGRYTELFFLDEATALAAGHRPCGECRRADLRRFGAAWRGDTDGSSFALAWEIDAKLREERRLPVAARAKLEEAGAALADGLMFGGPAAGEAYVAVDGRLRRWMPSGYLEPGQDFDPQRLVLLTPPSTAAALAAGYRPQIDPSAFRRREMR